MDRHRQHGSGGAMMLRGGVSDKNGNLFEKLAVRLHLLRVLLEEDKTVTWEPRETEGADFTVEGSDGRIVVQCKTRSIEPWSPSALKDPLTHARRLLDDGMDRYRFLTDQKPGTLMQATESARSDLTDEAWLAEDAVNREKYAQHLGGRVDGPAELAAARGYLARIQIQVMDLGTLRTQVEILAKSLTDQPSCLLQAFEGTVERPENLGATWSAVRLRQALEAYQIPWKRGEWAGNTTWLAERQEEWRRDIKAARRRRARLPRAETERVTAAIGELSLGGLVVVHGAAGSGKSEILGQVAERLHERGVTVLPLRADAAGNRELYGTRSPIQRLVAISGGSTVCLLIDQLDQAVEQSQHLRELQTWVQEAVRAGMVVIIGCRTVDVRQETRLHQVLYHLNRDPVAIEVGPLPEAIVQQQLNQSGVALVDLDQDLRRLVSNPMLLGLMQDVVQQRGMWRESISLWDLVRNWCESLVQTVGPTAVEVLDAIADGMERHRTLSVLEDTLPSHLLGMTHRLLGQGILIRDHGVPRIRIFHQTIADVRLVRTWLEYPSAQAVIDRLGTPAQQGLREAKRLRLCVPLWAARGPQGVVLVRDLVFHEGLRPLLQRALLLGLAEVQTVDPALCRLMVTWLDHPSRRSLLLGMVVRGSAPWFLALGSWLDRAWIDHPEEEWLYLDLCASVSIRCGDAVARHLAGWERSRPGILKKAHWVFIQNPSEDSDRLFELRLETLAYLTDREHFHVGWADLRESKPERAVRLFTALVGNLHWQDGDLEPEAMGLVGWVRNIPPTMTGLNWSIWKPLVAWWTSFTIPTLRLVKYQDDLSGDGVCALAVEALAQAAAAALDRGEMTWQNLREHLPTPLRDQDAWLLLRVGALFSESEMPQQVAEDAIAWFMSDFRWAQIAVADEEDDKRCRLAGEFLTNCARELSDSSHENLQRWLVTYPDSWTIEDERYRLRWGDLRPNHRGLTAWVLLPALGQERWTEDTKSRYNECDQKFRGHQDHLFRDRKMLYGFVGSPIPTRVGIGWSTERWITELQNAPRGRQSLRQRGAGRLDEHSLETLLHHVLRPCAQEDPVKFACLALAVAVQDPALDDEVYSTLLEGIGRLFVNGNPTLAPLGESDLLAVVEHPAFRDRPACAVAVARLVERHDKLPWSEAVLTRLMELATNPAKATRTQENLLTTRFNDPGCLALHALADMVESRPGLRPGLMDLAEGLAQHQCQARRASVARVAFAVFDAYPERSARVLVELTRDHAIAAESDLRAQFVWAAAHKSLDQQVQRDLRQNLLILAKLDEKEAGQAVGYAALHWWVWGHLDEASYRQVINANSVIRREAARCLAAWLGDPDLSQHLVTEVLKLANSPEPEVGAVILSGLRKAKGSPIFQDLNFIRELTKSPAVQAEPERFITLCDDHGTLLPLADILTGLVSALPTTGQTWKLHHQREELASRLLRLYEEAEQAADHHVAQQALDALDTLILEGLSLPSLFTRLTAQDGGTGVG
jgi:hypothetical protein